MATTIAAWTLIITVAGLLLYGWFQFCKEFPLTGILLCLTLNSCS